MGGLGAGSAVGGYYFLNSRGHALTDQHGSGSESGGFGQPASKTEEGNIPAKVDAKDAVKCFKGGDQGFVSLLLADVEEINHNTKRFRFHLPEEGAVSGLNVTCKFWHSYSKDGRLIRDSCSYHQVQGPRDAEASHPTIYSS